MLMLGHHPDRPLADLRGVPSLSCHGSILSRSGASDEPSPLQFFAAADLLNLSVDVLLFDTTSTYFETEDEDALRQRGHSKDHRPDLPQIVIGLAVTSEGIPVRCWTPPGDTNDQTVIEEVKAGLRGSLLGRVNTVVDRGITSTA